MSTRTSLLKRIGLRALFCRIEYAKYNFVSFKYRGHYYVFYKNNGIVKDAKRR